MKRHRRLLSALLLLDISRKVEKRTYFLEQSSLGRSNKGRGIYLPDSFIGQVYLMWT